MGTDNGGVVVKAHDGQSKTFTTADGLPSDTVHALLPDSSGNLWLGTTEGLVKYSKGRFDTFDLTRLGLSNWVTSLLETHEGILWAGTDNGLAKVHDNQISAENFSTGLIKRRIRWLNQTRDGNLWVGTFDGVMVRRDGQWQNPSHPTLSEKGQQSFLQDNDGGLWFGSQIGEGLSWYKEGSLSTYNKADGLFDNYVWAIAEDRQQRLWMISDHGINVVSRQHLEQNANNDGELWIRSTTLGPLEGLELGECNGASPGYTHTLAGKLIFPCMVGLVEIDPQAFNTDVEPPTPVIDFIALGDRKDWFPEALTLSPTDRDMTFKYGGLSFFNPDKMQFRYRLVGYSEQWQMADTRRQASYTNLSAGDYVLEVKARNYNGDWSDSSARLSFTIEPYFHESGWFYVLLILLSGYLFYQLSQLRLKYALMRQKEIDDARIEYLSNLIHNIAHNLNTPVGIAITGSSMLPDYRARVLHMLETGKITKKALVDLAEGLNQSGDVIGKSLTTVSGLIETFKKLNIDNYSEDPCKIDFTAFAKSIQDEAAFAHPKRNIDWQWDIAHDLKAKSYPKVLTQVLLILIENTVKHGYAEDEMVVIKLKIWREQKQLFIRYRDTGCGITKAQSESLFIPFSNRIGDEKGLGLGMNILYNLVNQKLQGQIDCEQVDQGGVSFLISFAGY